MTQLVEPSCISYWYPAILPVVPTPRTRTLRAQGDLWALLNGKRPAGWDDFITELLAIAESFGAPVFVRAGLGSAKHDWSRTCYLAKLNRPEMSAHVVAIVDWLACNGLGPRPGEVFAVRQFVPLVSGFSAWRGLPIARERRYFIRDGQVVCHHPYWPAGALLPLAERGELPPDWIQALAFLNQEPADELVTLTAHAQAVASLPEFRRGYWSIDFALGQNGVWYAIDMAAGERSWHPECGFKPHVDLLAGSGPAHTNARQGRKEGMRT
ncbi:MAG: ATP-grasp domain-containing protein [Phycisphaerae bacterium]|nr:ATP-grasp domain-containing protein [Phycisphaerae bacterium]